MVSHAASGKAVALIGSGRLQRTVSPLVVFVALLALFEVGMRLPYALSVASDPAYGYAIQFHYFSIFPPQEVIGIGLLVLGLSLLALLFVGIIDGATYPTAEPYPFPRIPASLHLIAAFFFGAVVLAIMQVGPEVIKEELSGYRTEVADFGFAYALLKLGNFLHVIAALYLIRLHQGAGRFIDRIGFAGSILLLSLLSIVFSQRAILVSLGLEIVYLQIMLGTFRLAKLMRLGGIIFAVLLTISILRPGVTFENWSEAVVFGLEKVLQSRYFLDFLKIGSAMVWDAQAPWLGPVSVGFLFEPFMPDKVIFYKELGPIIADEVYFFPGSTGGVTSGGLLEARLSFGPIGGIAFFAFLFHLFLRGERALFMHRRRSLTLTMAILLVVSKFSLFVNSSLGAFAYQACLELALLMLVMGVLWTLAEFAPRRQAGASWIRS
jgi:hypothetical protein